MPLEPTSDQKDPSAQAAPALLDMLICPVTHVPLRYDAERQELISDQAGLAYPIRDGIPVIIAENARRLENNGK